MLTIDTYQQNASWYAMQEGYGIFSLLITLLYTHIHMKIRLLVVLAFACLNLQQLHAQTDMDALMMNKQQFCGGAMYMHSAFDTYWEGTTKRNNLNLGKVTMQGAGVMANYGITNNINLIASLPYLATKASAGTMRGQHGLQDISAAIKWKFSSVKKGAVTYTGLAVVSATAPASSYNADYLPLSLGSGSKTASIRILEDVQYKRIFFTASQMYTARNNIRIARDAYYTTDLILSNEVALPNIFVYAFRAGLRSNKLIAEGTFTGMRSLGGFDISKNNMPFPSNRMNSYTLGVNAKYSLPFCNHLQVTGSAGKTLNGRNIGAAKSYSAGLFYFFNTSHRAVKS